MVKDGLYYKKVRNGKIQFGEEEYKIPKDAQYHTLVRVNKGEAELVTTHGHKICTLEKTR